MNKGIKLLLLLTTLIVLASCGNRKSPTGGPVDTENPVIVAVIPEQYSDITGQNVEITFSKPIDRSSIYEGDRGIQFYPPVSDKRFRWSDNTLTIEINEELLTDRNYYMVLSEQIRDLRRNTLDQQYLFVYHTGNLHDNRIYGEISYEKEADIGSLVTLTLLSSDSLRVLSLKASGTNYSIDNLDNQDYILRAFIDKNKNLRYDRGNEPYYETTFRAERNKQVDIHLEYYDDNEPVLRNVRVDYQNLITVNFDKPIKQIGEIKVTAADSLETPLPVRIYDIRDSQLEIVTAPMDSTKYNLRVLEVEDLKNNVAPELEKDFQGSTREDTSDPKIVSTIPRNGAVVNRLRPDLIITFNKFMDFDNIDMLLTDTISGEDISIEIKRENSRQISVTPKIFLRNRTPYSLEILDTSKDIFGNHLAEVFILQFLPISSE